MRKNGSNGYLENGESSSSSAYNGEETFESPVVLHKPGKPSQSVAILEMCYFCFDVLYASLYHKQAPSRPNFTNDQL